VPIIGTIPKSCPNGKKKAGAIYTRRSEVAGWNFTAPDISPRGRYPLEGCRPPVNQTTIPQKRLKCSDELSRSGSGLTYVPEAIHRSGDMEIRFAFAAPDNFDTSGCFQVG